MRRASHQRPGLSSRRSPCDIPTQAQIWFIARKYPLHQQVHSAADEIYSPSPSGVRYVRCGGRKHNVTNLREWVCLDENKSQTKNPAGTVHRRSNCRRLLPRHLRSCRLARSPASDRRAAVTAAQKSSAARGDRTSIQRIVLANGSSTKRNGAPEWNGHSAIGPHYGEPLGFERRTGRSRHCCSSDQLTSPFFRESVGSQRASQPGVVQLAASRPDEPAVLSGRRRLRGLTPG